MAKSEIERPKFPDDYEDISDELYREYTYPDYSTVRIYNPTHLHVSKSGGHRVVEAEDSDGYRAANYVRAGWNRLRWMNRKGAGPAAF